MSLQKIKRTFDNLPSCTAWSLQLLNARAINGEFAYNTHDITVTTLEAIIIEELIDCTRVSISLFTIINPFKVLKHALAYDGDSFKVLKDKYLMLRGYVDVAIIDDTAYLF